MIDEIINDIKTAEDKAEQIMQESYLKGREIVLNAEKQADQRIKSSILKIDAYANKVVERFINRS